MAASLAVTFGSSSAVLGSDTRASAKVQARAVASEFFRTINERRYARTCDLLSSRFYAQNKIPGKRQCTLRLRIGFLGSDEIRFRISGVSVGRDRAVVRAFADGAPGRVVLVRERGRFKVLDLERA